MFSNVPTPATAFQNRQFSAISAASNSNWRPSVPKPRFCSHAHIQGSTKREAPPTWQSSSRPCGSQKKGTQRRAVPAKPKACESRKWEGLEKCRELKKEREFGIDTANLRQTSRSARSRTRAVEGANSARTSTSRWTSMVSTLPCLLQRRHTDLHETPISSPHQRPLARILLRLPLSLVRRSSRANTVRLEHLPNQGSASSPEPTIRHPTRMPSDPTLPLRPSCTDNMPSCSHSTEHWGFPRTHLGKPSLPLPGSRPVLTRRYSPNCLTLPIPAGVPATRNL